MPEKVCAAEGCENRYGYRDRYCGKHRSRMQKYGRLDIPEFELTFEQRFWRKVDKRGADECWYWTAFTNQHGYGMVGAGLHLGQPKIWLAHRVAYTLSVGPIPPGLPLDHVCHSQDLSCGTGVNCAHRRCVNPNHLEPVTPAVNAQRAAARIPTCVNGHPKGPNSRTTTGGCRACQNEASRARRRVVISAPTGRPA